MIDSATMASLLPGLLTAGRAELERQVRVNATEWAQATRWRRAAEKIDRDALMAVVRLSLGDTAEWFDTAAPHDEQTGIYPRVVLRCRPFTHGEVQAPFVRRSPSVWQQESSVYTFVVPHWMAPAVAGDPPSLGPEASWFQTRDFAAALAMAEREHLKYLALEEERRKAAAETF
jgi:hypothetical protein